MQNSMPWPQTSSVERKGTNLTQHRLSPPWPVSRMGPYMGVRGYDRGGGGGRGLTPLPPYYNVHPRVN